MTVSMQVEDIGPEQAQTLLAQHPKNRRLSSVRVGALARSMKAGEWVFDASPIRVDDTGSLVDGQHRLNAVILAEVTLPMLVVRGVETGAMATMDTGKSRSFADVLTINDPNVTDANNIAAATRIVYLWEQGVRGRSMGATGGNTDVRTANASHPALLEFYLPRKQALAETSQVAAAIQRKVPVNRAGLSLAVWVLYALDTEDAGYFFDRLMDGVKLEQGSAILAVRKRLTEAALDGEKFPNYEVVALLFKAWNFYREGRPMQVASWKQGGAHPEAFPEPK